MSKLPEAVIEAAASRYDIDKGYDTNESVARRVILALAEDIPADAVEEACYASGWGGWNNEMRTAISAFLKHVAEIKDVGGE